MTHAEIQFHTTTKFKYRGLAVIGMALCCWLVFIGLALVLANSPALTMVSMLATMVLTARQYIVNNGLFRRYKKIHS